MTLKFKHNANLLDVLDVDLLPAFPDKNKFPHLLEIERQYQSIMDEWNSVPIDDLFLEHPQDIYKGGWEFIPLVKPLYDKHKNLDRDLFFDKQFPKTTEIVRNALGNRPFSLWFSRLKSGTELVEHRGNFANFLRAHLGIDIPAGDVKLKVSGEERTWSNGEILVFDDRQKHSAWNNTDKDRIILIIDFVVDDDETFFKE
jgi:aspartyl/asparaginyl beta-hydroxylase (cupin superfamily)